MSGRGGHAGRENTSILFDAISRLPTTAVRHLHVLVPLARRLGDLEHTLEDIGRDRRREALIEPRLVAPDPPHAALERHAVRSAHPARVEVVRDEAVAGLRSA